MKGANAFKIEIIEQMKTIIDLFKMYSIKPTLSEFIELTNRIAVNSSFIMIISIAKNLYN